MVNHCAMPSIGQTWVLASIGAVVEMGILSTLKRLLMESTILNGLSQIPNLTPNNLCGVNPPGVEVRRLTERRTTPSWHGWEKIHFLKFSQKPDSPQRVKLK
jgi:hypothetical protein